MSAVKLYQRWRQRVMIVAKQNHYKDTAFFTYEHTSTESNTAPLCIGPSWHVSLRLLHIPSITFMSCLSPKWPFAYSPQDLPVHPLGEGRHRHIHKRTHAHTHTHAHRHRQRLAKLDLQPGTITCDWEPLKLVTNSILGQLIRHAWALGFLYVAIKGRLYERPQALVWMIILTSNEPKATHGWGAMGCRQGYSHKMSLWYTEGDDCAAWGSGFFWFYCFSGQVQETTWLTNAKNEFGKIKNPYCIVCDSLKCKVLVCFGQQHSVCNITIWYIICVFKTISITLWDSELHVRPMEFKAGIFFSLRYVLHMYVLFGMQYFGLTAPLGVSGLCRTQKNSATAKEPHIFIK